MSTQVLTGLLAKLQFLSLICWMRIPKSRIHNKASIDVPTGKVVYLPMSCTIKAMDKRIDTPRIGLNIQAKIPVTPTKPAVKATPPLKPININTNPIKTPNPPATNNPVVLFSFSTNSCRLNQRYGVIVFIKIILLEKSRSEPG